MMLNPLVPVDWQKTLSQSALLVALLLPQWGHAEAYDDFLFAVRFNNVSVVKDFLRKGMDANSVEGNRGETMLMLALRENSMSVFDQLLKADDIKLEARAINGDTALMLACFLGNTEAVKKLIAAGAEINQPGWAPLHYAAAKGNTEIIALLLEHFAYIDTESPNKTTPLMMAVHSGNLDAVSLLLQEGADPRLKNMQGMTALNFAEEIEQREIAALLQQKMQVSQ